ncbi:MAG: hypothetical protein C0180_05730 [Aciduliprofundum sp.]|jgi:hypothetical protein|nr:MAG: hypothetical protein C0180_05730 [Aciduliprofundum sp.]
MTDIDILNAGEIKMLWDLCFQYFEKGYKIKVYYYIKDEYPLRITEKNDIFMIDRGFRFYKIDDNNKTLDIYLR